MKLPANTPLHVSLEFRADRCVEVGRLGLTDRQVIFEQKRSFVESGLVLHPLFPSVTDRVIYPKASRTFEGLHGVFADSLPDAWGRELIRRRAQVGNVDFNSLSALDRLALIGTAGPGALTYRPAFPETQIERIDLDVLAQDALAIVEGKHSSVLDQLVRLGGSSGGARPKISVAMSDGDLRALNPSLPAGYEAWIVKFRSPNDPRDAGPLEAAYADMARAAGLEVADTKLLASNIGPGYFATKRFDRTVDGRLHMVSSAGMLEADWTIPGDYETLLKLTRRVTRDQKSVEAVYRRAVFNALAHNRDDHWKQHSFLMDGDGRWSVAPTYDVTFSPGPGGEHYLTIGGLGKDATFSTFLDLAAAERIDVRLVRTIIEEITAAIARYPEFAKKYGASAASTRRIMKALTPVTLPPTLRKRAGNATA